MYDGHNGKLAAISCAKHLHKNVMQRFTKLVKATSCISSDEAMAYLAPDAITRSDKMDALFCESMRLSCLELDESIRAVDKSGTAMLSLVFFHDPEERSIRAYCSNIGNSRCVVFSSDLASVLPYREQVLTSLDDSMHTDCSDQEINAAFDVYDPDAPVRTYMMSEDHVFSLLRERSRTLGKNGRKEWIIGPVADWIPLPANAVALPNSDRTAILSPFEVGYPSANRIHSALDAIELVKSICSVTGSIEPTKLLLSETDTKPSPSSRLDILQPSHSSHDDSDSASIDDSHHSTDRRSRTSSHISDDAIHSDSTHGWSKLTRSIGDDDAPDICIAVPEISAVTIENHECARFVMATDGLWACLSQKDVRDAAISIVEPQELANFLVSKAGRRHYHLHNRKHDISVVVVDVNHNLLLGSTISSEAKKSKCAMS